VFDRPFSREPRNRDYNISGRKRYGLHWISRSRPNPYTSRDFIYKDAADRRSILNARSVNPRRFGIGLLRSNRSAPSSGDKWFPWFRVYGPEKATFDKILELPKKAVKTLRVNQRALLRDISP
jgi:hypothetical protein